MLVYKLYFIENICYDNDKDKKKYNFFKKIKNLFYKYDKINNKRYLVNIMF